MASPRESESLTDTLGLVVAIASVTAVGLGISLTIPLLSITLEARGISAGWIGINTAASGLASMAITPFVPRLAARLGTGVLLAGSILLFAATLPVFYIVASFPLWFPLRFVAGAAIAATFILSEFWIAAAAPASRRGLVMGVYATVLSVGFALGPGVLTLTGTAGGLPFVIGALIIAAAALPVIVAPVRSPAIGAHPSGGFTRFLFLAPVATAAALVFGIAESGSFALLPVYGGRAGHPPGQVILFASAITLGNVALQLPFGIISDRVDRRRLLFVIALAGLAGAIALPFAIADMTAALALLFVWGGFIGALYTVGLAHLAQRFTGAELAASNSAFVFCYSAGALVGPALLGIGMEAYDPHGFAVVLAACFVAYIILIATRIARVGRGKA